MMDDSDDFFGTQNAAPKALRPLGLVVPAPARVIYDAKGNVLYDELVVLEQEYRLSGKTPVVFEEEDGLT